ncbi:MAG TPA: hydrogenase 4 subunit F [Myxococcaceae bacterium]|nr:hydrogenase 4 subunit F [Myxococcaceae bacterium]
MELLLVLGIPLLGAAVLAVVGARRHAAEVNAGMSLATLGAAAMLVLRVIRHGPMLVWREQFFIDPFNVFLVALTAFVGFTTALFSRPYMRIEEHKGRITPRRLRLYHSMYQLFMAAMLLALLTNNMGILWVAMEAATLSTVLLVSLYRTRASLEAAWKYFILCGVGIAQALFGTILLYFAAEGLLGAEGMTALLWTHLDGVKAHLEPTVIALAFVFLLVGYGTKVGLAPLHNWLPDAHAEGPTPVSAVLSGLLLNVALYAVIRCKVLAEGSLHQLPGRMLMGFGLLSAILAAFFLWRQRDIKRLFAYSSIEHMGIVTFAFGMGGPVANFAALLHMTVHSLTKSAIFFAAGHATQTAGTQRMDGIRGLLVLSPTIGWGLMLGALAILGLPPFGVFASEFLILTTAMRDHPWATPILLAALGVAFAAIFGRVQPMVFGETHGRPLPHSPALLPVFVHLAMVLLLGLYMPPALAEWYRLAARLIG